MYQIKSITKIKLIIIILSLEGINCTIDGTFSNRRPNDTKTGDDPCNPLYWYPREIPEYCHFKNAPTPPSISGPDMPIPVPIPVPVPPPMPVPMPLIPPPVVPPIMMPPPPPIPHPIMPLPMPLPFGIPLAPTNPTVPVAGVPLAPPMPVPYSMPYPQYTGLYQPPFPQPYPSAFPPPYPAPYPPPFPAPYQQPFPSPFPIPPRRGIGMVPGIPGLVSPDGGINIMPFSDAYSDMLEKHKQKMIRRRLQKMMSQYDRPPWKSHRNARRQNEMIEEDLGEKLSEDNTIE